MVKKKMILKENVSLKPYNTFGLEAKARFFYEFNTVEELRSILNDPKYKDESVLILGGGSNILLTSDFEGLVLLNRIMGKNIIKEDEEHAWVKSGAGEIWHDLVLYAIENRLGGIENLSLIPGTVGAAPMQNIGAYGVELKDTFESLEAYEFTTGKVKTFSYEECCFGYRNSVFKNELKGKYIITSVTLRLNKKPVYNVSYGTIKETLTARGVKDFSLKAISDAVCEIRMSKLPDPKEIGNSGSFFKNPEIPEEQYEKLKKDYPDMPSYPTEPGMVKIPAGWLNEKAGWKGKTFGNYGVHKKQALVLVNYGGASGQEIKELSDKIKASVKEKFGIELETEVNII